MLIAGHTRCHPAGPWQASEIVQLPRLEGQQGMLLAINATALISSAAMG